VMISPVTWPLNLGLAKYAMVPVISSGVAIFFIGVVANAAERIRGLLRDSNVIGVLC
jgi:hypothetical protein